MGVPTKLAIVAVRVKEGAKIVRSLHQEPVDDPKLTWRSLFYQQSPEFAGRTPRMQLGHRDVEASFDTWVDSDALLDLGILSTIDAYKGSGKAPSSALFILDTASTDPARPQEPTPKRTLMEVQSDRKRQRLLPSKRLERLREPVADGSTDGMPPLIDYEYKIQRGRDRLHDAIVDWLATFESARFSVEQLTPDGTAEKFIRSVSNVFWLMGEQELEALTDVRHQGRDFVISTTMKPLFDHQRKNKKKAQVFASISSIRQEFIIQDVVPF